MFLQVRSCDDEYRRLIIVDSEFEEKITLSEFEELDNGLSISWIEGIIGVYERREKNVAANLVRVLQWTRIARHEIYKTGSAAYARYAPQIEKLLVLI